MATKQPPQKRSRTKARPEQAPGPAETAPLTLAEPPVRVLAPGLEWHLDRVPGQMAMYWANVVRNRVRWSADPDALPRVREDATGALGHLGLGRDALIALSKTDSVEVEVPFTQEEQDWEARILPWEFLLSTAISAFREAEPIVVIRRLVRASPFTPHQKAPGSVLTVASLPGKLVASEYEFDSELALVQANLGASLRTGSLRNPTLNQLRAVMGRPEPPDVVHLTGIDLHQGNRLLGLPEARSERTKDAYFMAAEDGSAAAVYSQELADAVNAGDPKPLLVSCNFYYSAARTAALIAAGGAQAAIGFQDEIDDLIAEQFFTLFYRTWRELNWDLLRAFRLALLAAGSQSKTFAGVVLWTNVSLLATPTQTSVRQDLAQVQEIRKGTGTGGAIDVVRDLNTDIKPVDAVNYSLLHNRQSMFKTFCLRNLNQELTSIRGLRLHIELCAGEQNFPFRSLLELEAGSPKELKDDILIPLTSALFRSLRESIQSVLFVRLSVGEQDILEQTYPVRLLAIDEWVDKEQLNAFLPSFVLPRDPAVLRVIDAAQRHLMTLTDDPGAGFEGYQSGDMEAVDLQVWAIWSALSHDYPLSYINPPPTFTDASQRLRSPSDVIEGRRGTCIDLALLLAACLEYVGIYPVLFLLNGHAFPGYWRSEEGRQQFVQVRMQPQDGTEPVPGGPSRYPWLARQQTYDEVLQLLRTGELAPLESVWLTQHKGYWDSRDSGVENLRSPAAFEAMIDVKGARDNRVTPLPVTRG